MAETEYKDRSRKGTERHNIAAEYAINSSAKQICAVMMTRAPDCQSEVRFMEFVLGFLIATAVELTGVSAGSITAPVLIFFDLAPAAAVGTALTLLP